MRSTKTIKNLWHIWAKTLGNKISENNKVSDYAAGIRTLWVLLQVVTCIAIITNVIHHW